MCGTSTDRQPNPRLLGIILLTTLVVSCGDIAVPQRDNRLPDQTSSPTETDSSPTGSVTEQLASTQANGCQTFINDPQPPTNVRSSPVINPSNIVGTLKNGTVITVSQQRSSWLQISAPLRGWVAVNLSAVSCSPPSGGMTTTASNIRQLSSQAMSKNRLAADTLVRYSMQADGAYAELLSETLTTWARRDPGFLVSVLDGQPDTIRRKAIVLLDYGLTTNDRPPFDAVIAALPKTSPTRQVWQTRPRRST